MADDWKDNYRQGSFRGVEFKAKSHKYDSGRHDVEHEFPSKREGNTEDLGQRLPKHMLELYVLGDDYFEQRDALMEALDQEGPGQLIHPYLGTKQVQVGKYTVQETVEEGRMARFSVEFNTAGIAQFPAESVDAFQSILDAVDKVLDAATAALEAGFSVLNAPARVAEAAADLVDGACDRIDKVVKIVGTSAQGVADVAFAIRNIRADVVDLVKAPGLLAQRFRDAFGLLADAVEDFKDLAESLSGETSSFSPDPVIGADTPTVNKLIGNQLAFENFFVSVSIATQSSAAIQGNYLSVNEALVIRDLINSDIEDRLLKVTDDDTYQELKDLQVAANIGLPPQDVGELISYTPPETMPALVICQKLFGNIVKADEIVSHNHVSHPGFVPGLIPIEVSTDG